jgi:dTMP kinase
MSSKGIFISIEGIDGSGTTTLMGNIEKKLISQGKKVHTTSEPSNGVVGKLIRSILTGETEIQPDSTTLALLFASDRFLHYNYEIKPKLAEGYIVITDRYALSSYAYQSINEDLGWIKTLNSKVPQPNFTIFVELDPHEAMERIIKRGNKLDALEKLDFQKIVNANYISLLKTYSSPLLKLSGTDTPQELQIKAISEITKIIA